MSRTSPECRQSTHARTRAAARVAALLWVSALLALGCASATPIEKIATPDSVEFAYDDVRVRLVFGPEADLDLIVTDPNHEELYFANPQSRLGGLFDGDARCDSPSPRVETVSFTPAPIGRYRVSVDFMLRCEPGIDSAPFRLIVEANGEENTIEGVARFGEMQHITYQFAVKALEPGRSEWEESSE
jgi:hypothetical protein